MAKIDTSRIDGYAEMTAEQKLAVLEAFEYEDGASEIEKLKSINSKANSEAAEWKRKHNALLSDEEKRKAEEEASTKELQEKYDELLKKTTISDYKAKYLAMGYDEKLATETATALVEGNMDKVFANGEKYKAEMEKRIKAEVLRDTPKPTTIGGTDGPLTREKIVSIKDPIERQAAWREFLTTQGKES